MRGSKFEHPDITAAFQQQRLYELHQKKLEQLGPKGVMQNRQGQSPTNMQYQVTLTQNNNNTNLVNEIVPSRFLTSRILAQEHRETEKLSQIKYENELLLKKLVQISQGKQISVGKHIIPDNNKKPKTLHLTKKKLDAERIDYDNLRLLQKINNISATLPKQKLDKDWSVQRSYQQIVQRSARKDLQELYQRRRDFLQKNFQILPGIKDTSRSREDTQTDRQRVIEGSTLESQSARDKYTVNSYRNNKNSLIQNQKSLGQENDLQKRTKSSGYRYSSNVNNKQGSTKRIMQRTNFSEIHQKSNEEEEATLPSTDQKQNDYKDSVIVTGGAQQLKNSQNSHYTTKTPRENQLSGYRISKQLNGGQLPKVNLVGGSTSQRLAQSHQFNIPLKQGNQNLDKSSYSYSRGTKPAQLQNDLSNIVSAKSIMEHEYEQSAAHSKKNLNPTNQKQGSIEINNSHLSQNSHYNNNTDLLKNNNLIEKQILDNNKSVQRSSKMSGKESQFSTELKHSFNDNFNQEKSKLTDELSQNKRVRESQNYDGAKSNSLLHNESQTKSKAFNESIKSGGYQSNNSLTSNKKQSQIVDPLNNSQLSMMNKSQLSNQNKGSTLIQQQQNGPKNFKLPEVSQSRVQLDHQSQKSEDSYYEANFKKDSKTTTTNNNRNLILSQIDSIDNYADDQFYEPTIEQKESNLSQQKPEITTSQSQILNNKQKQNTIQETKTPQVTMKQENQLVSGKIGNQVMAENTDAQNRQQQQQQQQQQQLGRRTEQPPSVVQSSQMTSMKKTITDNQYLEDGFEDEEEDEIEEDVERE